MKINNLVTSLVMLAFCSSCIYEPVQKLEQYIHNNTSNDVKMDIYRNSVKDSTIIISKNSTFLMYTEVGEQVGNIEGSHIQNSDSIVFSTDEHVKSHYSYKISAQGLRGVYSTEEKSFYGKGWKGTVVQEQTKKKGKEVVSRFYIENDFFE